jgi:D-glycero-D-manno-heptose 1,7-bisphosphate phosphatase
VFLDRDGVLVEERGLLTPPEEARLLDGIVPALARLHRAGYALVVVSNQAVVARGLMREDEVCALQERVAARVIEAGGPPLDGFYYCPHHPNADVAAYRVACECRKPRAGLLRRAAEELALDLAHSTMVGDRVTDILAGRAAGCGTVLLRSGAHDAPPIETPDEVPGDVQADRVCDTPGEMADWILGGDA